jgi:hypothetical protein
VLANLFGRNPRYGEKKGGGDPINAIDLHRELFRSSCCSPAEETHILFEYEGSATHYVTSYSMIEATAGTLPIRVRLASLNAPRCTTGLVS